MSGPTLYYSSILDGSTTHYPGKECAVIFLGGCPLRCPWCYVPALLSRNTCVTADVGFFADHYKHLAGCEAVCLTGGEPLEQGDAIVALCKALKAQGALMKVETSGFHPETLAAALPHLDYVSFDIKARLELDSYFRATGSRGSPLTLMTNIIRSIDLLKKSRKVFREFTTTIVPGLNDNAEAVAAIAAEIGPVADLYVLQQFRSDLELVDGLYQGLPSTPKEKLMALAEVAKKSAKAVAIRTTDDGEVRL